MCAHVRGEKFTQRLYVGIELNKMNRFILLKKLEMETFCHRIWAIILMNKHKQIILLKTMKTVTVLNVAR